MNQPEERETKLTGEEIYEEKRRIEQNVSRTGVHRACPLIGASTQG
jgi:hypothetical protein